MRNYESKIPKKELVHGAYYSGRCRNATIARWNGTINKFIHWREKYGQTFLESICHSEEQTSYDVFVVDCEILQPEKQIPIK